MKTAKETKETEDFKKYLTNARNKVSLFALSHISDVPTRTEIDSFVIAFDQLEERYYYLLKQLDASQSKWVSCAERLPDEHRRYLCMAYIVDCYVEEVCLYDKENKRFLFNRVEVKVSHYQSLPDKPVEK